MLTVNKGAAAGRLIGGNLNTIMGIWGTQYMTKIKSGDILFIEDSYKNIETIERSFSLLKLDGIFDKIGGIILGKHEKFDDMCTGRKSHDILCEVIGLIDFPILAKLDCCHTHPMLTIPIGAIIELNATDWKVCIISE